MLLCRNDALVAEDLGQRIALKVQNASWLILDGTAATLWRVLQDPLDFDEVVSQLISHYDGDPDIIRRDTTETVMSWIEKGILIEH
jgi:hypothetical protein